MYFKGEYPLICVHFKTNSIKMSFIYKPNQNSLYFEATQSKDCRKAKKGSMWYNLVMSINLIKK